jgi:hypothetical protein
MRMNEVKSVLTGAGLSGRVEELDGDVVLVHGIDPEDLLSQWRRVRSLVEVTGRWPVAVTLDDVPPNFDLDLGDPEAAVLVELGIRDVEGGIELPTSVLQKRGSQGQSGRERERILVAGLQPTRRRLLRVHEAGAKQKGY